MSFAASFVASQDATGNLTIVATSDHTSEAKSTFTDRYIRLLKSDGTLFLGSAIPFGFTAFPSDTIVINNLDRDYAFAVELVYVSASPVTGSTYTKRTIVAVTYHLMKCLYEVSQQIAANPIVRYKGNFYPNLQELYTEINNCNLAVAYADVANAQAAIDRVYKFVTFQTMYF